MSSINRPLRTCLLILALGWCLTPVGASAQEAPLGEVALPPSPILIDLADAVVRIVADDGLEPELRWRRVSPDAPGSAELSVVQEGGSIVVERPAPAEGEVQARLLIEITMPTTHAVAVHGTGLDLSIERKLVEEPEQSVQNAPPPVASTPTATEIRLVDSQAALTGIGAVIGAFDGCIVELYRTTGVHELSSIDGELRLDSHHGHATVVCHGTDVTADGTTGRISVKATGGSVELRSTQGRFKIETTDAHVQILDSRGSGIIAVTDSNVDLRNTRLQDLNFKGISSYATMTSCDGKTTVDFSGGSLSFDSVTGNLTGTARDGARIDLTDHRGEVKLNLQQDSSADLRSIDGAVTITARGAELSLDGAKSLALTAAKTWATVSAIDKLEKFQVSSSDVDLDLVECRDRTPTVTVQADSRVRVRLATPCRVKAKGLSASMASQVDVTGCELQLGQGSRWATRRARDIDGKLPITLTAQVAESSELTIEGR